MAAARCSETQVLAVPGNHDILKWFAPDGYKELLSKNQLNSGISAYCDGEVGIQQSCRFGNIFVILSGIGTLGTNHLEYLDKSLKMNSNMQFKFCIWHKNQHLLQTGDKPDEIGYQAYGRMIDRDL